MAIFFDGKILTPEEVKALDSHNVAGKIHLPQEPRGNCPGITFDQVMQMLGQPYDPKLLLSPPS